MAHINLVNNVPFEHAVLSMITKILIFVLFGQAPDYVIWIHMCFNIDIDMDIWIHMEKSENMGLAFPGVGFTGFSGNKYRVQRQAPQDHLPYWASHQWR